VDWNAQIGWERAALYRIVALLLALADLAERAAGASRPVRCQVLWALRHAEAVACAFVTGGTHDPAAEQFSPDWMTGRSDPADAIDLAVSLRALAFMVQVMAAQLRPGRFLPEGHEYLERSAGNRPHYGIGGLIQRFCDAASPVERRDTS